MRSLLSFFPQVVPVNPASEEEKRLLGSAKGPYFMRNFSHHNILVRISATCKDQYDLIHLGQAYKKQLLFSFIILYQIGQDQSIPRFWVMRQFDVIYQIFLFSIDGQKGKRQAGQRTGREGAESSSGRAGTPNDRCICRTVLDSQNLLRNRLHDVAYITSAEQLLIQSYLYFS